MNLTNTKIWAHRGASAYAPDNTMPAFALAAEMKADGIEIDIHLTKDGIPVLCHDERLDHIAGVAGKVRDFTLAELRTMDTNRERFPHLGKVGIITLEECYRFAKQAGLFVNTEIKYYDDERWEELNGKALEIARQIGMEDRVIYSSFWHERLHALKVKEPKARIGLLYSEAVDRPWELAKSWEAQAIHPHFQRLFEQDLTAQCHRVGILVHPWTIDDVAVMNQALDFHVDAIISNRPDVVRQVKDSHR